MKKKVVEVSMIEKRIIRMIANEETNKAIARELNYSQRSIEYHINSVCKKFNVQTRVGIVCKAYQMKIIK